MARLWLGKTVRCHELELFPEETVEIIEYHPYFDGVGPRKVDLEKTLFHVESMNQSAHSMAEIILAYLVYKQLGLNNGALVAGICRMLKLGREDE